MSTSEESDASRDREQNSDSDNEEFSSDEKERKVPPLKISSLRRKKHNHLSSSDDENDDIARDDAESTACDKKLKAVDIKNPFSTFEKQTKRKKSHLPATKFVKEQWFALRGFDTEGKFVIGDETKYDSWKKVAPSEKILKKYGGRGLL